MDVTNGEVLALVSHPTYDANSFNPFPAVGRAAAAEGLDELLEDERNPQLNRVSQGVYVTGSVMKGLTAIAALESEVYDEESRYHCVGTWAYGADIRYDWLASGHGIMSVQSGITNSCNPFFYEAGFRLNAMDPWAAVLCAAAGPGPADRHQPDSRISRQCADPRQCRADYRLALVLFACR